MTNLVFTQIEVGELESIIQSSVAKALTSFKSIATPPQNPHERLTRQDIADQYRVSLGTIHNAMKSRKLPFEKVGRRTLFKRTEVEAWTGGKKKGGIE